jgi:hypothetical protein
MESVTRTHSTERRPNAPYSEARKPSKIVAVTNRRVQSPHCSAPTVEAKEKLVVNDRHPSGYYTPADTSPGLPYAAEGGTHYEQSAYEMYAPPGAAQHGYPAAYDGYDGYSTGAFDNLAVSYGDGDPLFGSLPGAQQPPAPGAATAPYPHDGFDVYGTYDAYAGYGTYDTGAHPTTAAWTETGGLPPGAGIPAQQGPEQPGYGIDGTGQWDTSWDTGHWDTAQSEPAAQDHLSPAGYDAYGFDTGFDTGAHAQDPAAHGYEAPYGAQAPHEQQYEQAHEQQPYEQQPYERQPYDDGAFRAAEPYASVPTPEPGPRFGPETELLPEHGGLASAAVPHPRGRRRPKPRRSALLTVAVPSVCVMGVAGAATASVMSGDQGGEGGTEQAAAETAVDSESSAANKKLDSQLAGVSRDADDFADRASRTQERLDLKQRQAAERARKAKEAARKEALRPKFVLPVKQRGLSARFGQGGVNWMSVHTGIDFPVSYGTPVMSATDGTITTKVNADYGNVAIVTMSDGTQILYAHLSSIKIRSGKVKAGDTIAYSGDSGNSTGPHLHFELRPDGGAAVDPLPWLRGKGLDPT